MKSVLIIGGSGLVGSSLIRLASNNMNVFFTFCKNRYEVSTSKSFFLDLLDKQNSAANLIKSLSPDVVVNTAAFQNVDYCELNHNMADQLHVKSTKEICSACIETSSKLIHFSSNFVFDGKKGFYNENDSCNPISYYGKTRLEAEKIVLESSQNNVILRTTVIYGWHKNSKFTNFVLKQLTNGLKLEAFTDQYGNPTLADDIAKCILKIISTDTSGLFHAVGKSCINRHEFALSLADKFGLNKDLIFPITSNEKQQVALRPSNGCLDTTKIKMEIGFEFCDIKTGISNLFDQFLKNDKKMIF